MDTNSLFSIFAFVIGITVVLSLKSIYIACHNSIALGSTKEFFSNVWDGSEGSLWVIIGILILCIPVYFILNIIISIKNNNPTYRIRTRLNSDNRYCQAIEAFNASCDSGTDISIAKQEALNDLISQGVNKDEAEETLTFFVLARVLSRR